MNLRKQISSSCRRLLLEEQYKLHLLQNEELKKVWMRKLEKMVENKNQKVANLNEFKDNAIAMYSKGLPVDVAIEKLFESENISGPGNWTRK